MSRSSCEMTRGSLTGRLTRRLSLVGGVVLATMLALVGPAAAQQAEPTGGLTSSLPPALDSVESVSAAVAVSPTISPAAYRVRYQTSNAVPSCPTGNLCLKVWDPARSSWKVFDLYYCRTYALSNWLGAGIYNNAQTGGVRVYFYDQNWNILRSFTSRGAGTFNWSPVWYIRNC